MRKGVMNRGASGGVLAAVMLLVVAGCGGARGEVVEASPAGSDSASSMTAVRGGGVSSADREVDVPARDRWASPFAVVSTGRPTPVGDRRVIVVSADPVIAAGLEAQRAMEAGAGAGSTDAGSGAAPAAAEVSASGTFLPPGANRAPGTDVVLEGDPITESDFRIHMVEPGETWTEIAATYGVNVSDLLDANPRIDPIRLREGQELVVPRD
jgi:LysM repeat protein